MGGNYEKGLYNQLMDVMARLDSMETEHKKDRREIASLTTEVKSLRKENSRLREELKVVKAENAVLRSENEILKKENQLLRDDNERMKRILGNDSSNSSLPPSTDLPGKAPNTYNSRKKTGRKAGAQTGHKGNHLSKKDVEKKIKDGTFEHHIKVIGTPVGKYVTRYRLDLNLKATATEIRIYEDANGKFHIPDDLKPEVSYGNTIKSIAALLYSEGVVANDRICTFLNSLSGDSLNISTGSVYEFCRGFSKKCADVQSNIEEEILNSDVLCTDATPVDTNGVQTWIRNFSTKNHVLFCSARKKDLDTLKGFSVLKKYTGILVHDHETALYHFGIDNAECNVHLNRYLKKNTEETGNNWSQKMYAFLNSMNHTRNGRIQEGITAFTEIELERYMKRYDAILACGMEQNQNTKGRIAKKEEKALLNRLKKYRSNHLLFLHDFRVPFSNNRSEKDLRICKSRQKMAGGFRNDAGREMYCHIMSVIETVKRQGRNIFQSIINLMNGTLVLN